MVQNNQDLHKICTTLDKLTLDSLTLMEKHIQNKMDLELVMAEGETNIAKARYIMGQNTVSKLQLPTEDSNQFNAIAVINSNDQDYVIRCNNYDLEMRKEVDGEVVQNPVRWFGVLVPQNLHYAQEKFKRAMYWVVNCANSQIQLQDTLKAYGKLLAIKNELKCEE